MQRSPSSHDDGPIGYEPVEFLDAPLLDDATGIPPDIRMPDQHQHPLSERARRDVARLAHDYISGLVGSHQGLGVDVRAVIEDLHAAKAFAE